MATAAMRDSGWVRVAGAVVGGAVVGGAAAYGVWYMNRKDQLLPQAPEAQATVHELAPLKEATGAVAVVGDHVVASHSQQKAVVDEDTSSETEHADATEGVPEHVRRDLAEVARQYHTGLSTAALVAYNFGDLVFVYYTGDADATKSQLHHLVEGGITNINSRVPLVEIVQTRHGAGAMAAGALTVGNDRVAVIASAQSLPLMVPSMMQMATCQSSVVFQVAAQCITSDLAIASDISGVMACRETGFSIIASYTVQEIYDIGVVAHKASAASMLPVLHAFDGVELARATAHVSTLNPEAIKAVDVPYKPHASASDVLDATMEVMAGTLGKRYSLFEYHGAEDATHVAVIFGAGAATFREVADDFNGGHGNAKVGVLCVRVYRPWSTAHFMEALPRTTERVCAAAVSTSSDAVNALLTDVIRSLHSGKGSAGPAAVSALIEPGHRGCCRSKVEQLFHNLVARDPKTSMVIGDSSLSMDLAIAPAVPTARPYSVCIWGSGPLDVLLHNIRNMVLGAGKGSLFAYTRVDRDTYHVSKPARAVVTFAATPDGARSTCVHDVVIVKDVAVLASHGDEIMASTVASTLLVVNMGNTATPVNASACLSQLVSKMYHRPHVFAVNASEVAAAADVEENEALAAVVVSVLAEQAPALAVSKQLAAQFLLAHRDGNVAAELAQKVLINYREITAELSAIDEDPDGMNSSTLVLQKSAYSFLVPRVPVTQPKSLSRRASQSTNLVKKHEIGWNVLFKNDAECKEVFRPYEHQQVWQVKLTKNQRLTPTDYHRNTFHLEFDTTGTGLTYGIGDALGVYGHNDEAEVLDFLKFYGVSPDDFVSIAHTQGADSHGKEEFLTIKQVFSQRLDLFGKPSQSFYAALALHSNDTYQKKRLKWLGSDDKEGFKLRQLESYTFADVLTEFATAHPPVEELIDMIPPIMPRHYSISSSMKMHPNAVHLLVVAVEWETPKGRKRVGQCTRYLADLDPTKDGDIFVGVDIAKSVMKLPKDPMQPVIGAALGTGLAPFRAFIQERAMLKAAGVAIGPMSMYFGARYRKQEYLYEADLEAAARDGVITDLRLAFSRDQEEKVYIQHHIVEDKAKLGQYLQKDGGHFYLCGPTWPVPEVRKALVDGLEDSARMKRADAEAYIDELKKGGRYVLEVY